MSKKDKVVFVNHNIQVSELATLATLHVSKWEDASEAVKGDELLSMIVADEKAKEAALTTSINRTKSASNLSDLDAKRDEILTELFDVVSGLRHSRNAEKKEAASAVNAVLSKYRGIARLSIANESGQVKSLLEDLEAEKANIALLDDVADIVADLSAAESAVLAELNKIDSDKVAAGESASEIKKQLVAIMNDELVPYLNVAKILKSDVYGDFADNVAASITRANATVDVRLKVSKQQA